MAFTNKSINIKNIAVFCGSSSGNSPVYREVIPSLVKVLCHMQLTLVYGGAKVGLMGLLADQMLENGGKVIGVIPRSLVDVEIAHQELTHLHIVDSMHARKALITKLADGFVALPGGTGTLDEFFEIFTWMQLGYCAKPCGILNVNHYYDQLLKFLDFSVNEGFMQRAHRDMIIVELTPGALIEKFRNYKPTAEKKWVDG